MNAGRRWYAALITRFSLLLLVAMLSHAAAARAEDFDGGAPPTVTIASRNVKGDTEEIKASISGTALKAAGIYQNGRCLKAFKIDVVPGQQTIELNLTIGNPPPDAVIRVTDSRGRSAEASLAGFADGSTSTQFAPAGGSALPDALPGSSGPPAGLGEGVPVGGSGGVADIPTHGSPRPSPSKRHTLAAKLADIHIDISSVAETSTVPPTYAIAGQISGRGVTHAGIYINGRLASSIPVDPSQSLANFDQQLVVNNGTATVRAYTIADQFVENAIDLAPDLASTANPGALPMVPASPPSAPGIGVEVLSIQPVEGNLFEVAGVISGRDLASAGLYQNGALASDISVSGRGFSINGGQLGSMLGGLLPTGPKSVNFKVRFNPAVGPASIRAYNKTGEYTEQTLMAPGVNPFAMRPAAPSEPR